MNAQQLEEIKEYVQSGHAIVDLGNLYGIPKEEYKKMVLIIEELGTGAERLLHESLTPSEADYNLVVSLAEKDVEIERLQKRLKEIENLFQITDEVLRKEYNKNENLREALSFYANDDNWKTFEKCIKIGNSMACKNTTKAEIDMGEIARQALENK